MFTIHHFGLYFSPDNVRTAQQNAKREPFKAAWALLRDHEQLDLLASTQWNGLRYRFNDDTAAGARAVVNLQGHLMRPLNDDLPYLESLRETLVLAQCFEMLRDHPEYSDGDEARWLDFIFDRASALNALPGESTYMEQVWLAALNIAIGVVLGREPVFESGVEEVRRIISEDIRPQGFIPALVEEKTADTLPAMLLALQGLTLAAEAATKAGVDLWAYEQRGVGLVTAGLYPLYYYYYPEKWPWYEGYVLEDAADIFKPYVSYLEILNKRIGRPTRAIDLILNEVRPVYSVYGGGLTTLSHAVPKPRGLFG